MIQSYCVKHIISKSFFVMDIAVRYCSKTKFAKSIRADVFEIVPKEPYTKADINYLKKRIIVGFISEIASHPDGRIL